MEMIAGQTHPFSVSDQAWLKLYFEQIDAQMTLWNVYVVVVALVVGFVAQKEYLEGTVKWLLLVAFTLFAFANGYPLYETQYGLNEIHCRLSFDVRDIFRVSPTGWVVGVHIAMDAVVIVLIGGWWRKWFKKNRNPNCYV